MLLMLLFCIYKFLLFAKQNYIVLELFFSNIFRALRWDSQSLSVVSFNWSFMLQQQQN